VARTEPAAPVAPGPEAGAVGPARRPGGFVRATWRFTVRNWSWLRFPFALGVLALAVWALSGHQQELVQVGAYLDHLRWWWILAGAMVEVGSLAAFAEVQYRILEIGGARVAFAPLLGMTFAAQSINNSLPAGAAFSSVYAYRWYRRLGADEKVAAWSLVGTLMAASVSLAVLAAAGVALAAEQSADDGLIWVVAGILVLAIAAGAALVAERPLVVATERGIALLHRVTGHPRDPEGCAARATAWITAVRLRPSEVVTVTLWALANWLLDCGCLVCAFLAVGAPVPWGGLLLAYGAGQLAANLPITPGGLGAVEGSITIALVAFGGGESTTVAAVIVYRIISFWAELPIGWAIAGVLGVGVRRGRWPRTPGAERGEDP